MRKHRLSIAERRDRAWLGVRHERRPGPSEKQSKLQLLKVALFALTWVLGFGYIILLWATDMLDPRKDISVRITGGVLTAYFALFYIFRPAGCWVRNRIQKKTTVSIQQNHV